MFRKRMAGRLGFEGDLYERVHFLILYHLRLREITKAARVLRDLRGPVRSSFLVCALEDLVNALKDAPDEVWNAEPAPAETAGRGFLDTLLSFWRR